MIQNYLTIALRNIRKGKGFSAINIAGLALGVACSLLILLWVQNERNVDAFHKNGNRLFAVYERIYSAHKPIAGYGTPGPLADELKKAIPEIQYASGFGFNTQHVFKAGEKMMKREGNSAQADFFKMFSYTLVQGNAASALNNPSGLAVSRTMAEDFFGTPQNAIGKTIRYDNKWDLIITAVFDNLPVLSTQKFDFLTSWNVFQLENPWTKMLYNLGPGTYIRLRADAKPALVEAKLIHFLNKYIKDGPNAESAQLGLQRYDQVYLHGNFTDGKIEGGRIGYVNLFSLVALFILLIACINFMNLATARSVKRAREIGVRKVIGALRSSLIRQFIIESLLITTMAVVIALALLVAALPAFNQITQKQINLPFDSLSFWIKIASITFMTGVISGSYPALFLSSFKPVKVLKGSFKIDAGTTAFRKGLVVFQFVLSGVLIIGTIIVSRQVDFIQSVNLGYDRENLIYIPLEADLPTKYEVLKNEALKMPGIASITRAGSTPANIRQSDRSIDWDGIDPNLDMLFTYVYARYDFVRTMKLQLVSGRDFSPALPGDSSGFMINEAASKIIGFKDPIGKRLKFRGREGKIIGVVKDFHFTSLHDQIQPLIIPFGEKTGYGNVLVRTQPGKTKEALASLASLFKNLSPDLPFTYSFSDEEYRKLYNNEQIVSKLANAFAFLAIFISCLGLLGLAMFTAEQRTKEIGIRKVLGANAASLFGLLSREFLGLVIIALFIATPIAWYTMNSWLQSFAYRAPMQWWIFAVSGAMTLLIAMITVSLQAVKAVRANPIKSLRSE